MILGSWLHAIFRPARPSVPVSSRRSDGLCYSATWLDSHGNSVAQQHTIDPTPGGVSTHSSISERHPWPEGPGRCRCPIALAQSKLPPHEHRERHHSQRAAFYSFQEFGIRNIYRWGVISWPDAHGLCRCTSESKEQPYILGIRRTHGHAWSEYQFRDLFPLGLRILPAKESPVLS